MKILSILGSPRTNGNTAILTANFLRGVKDQNPDYDIESINLSEINMEGCKGCYACQTGKLKYCVLKDDISNTLHHKILEADLIVFATPIYSFAMTSQMKVLFDRFFAIANKLVGKKVVTLTVYGDTNRESSGITNHLNIIKSLCSMTGMEHVGNYDVSTGIMPVKNNSVALNEVFEMGVNLK